MNSRPSPLSAAPGRPGPNWIVALAVCAVVLLPGGFFIGRYTAHSDVRPPAGADPKKVKDVQQSLDVALGEVEMQRTRNEVDSRALEMLRKEMAAEKERTAELEEGLSFYRSMVVSDDPEKGLYLRKPELVAGAAPNRIAYRIFVHQKEREFEIVEGELWVHVRGKQGNDEVSYSLAELSPNLDEGAIALHFRYFQSIEGEMVLPEGFEPEELILEARASKPRTAKVREVYPWLLQERLINVGQ